MALMSLSWHTTHDDGLRVSSEYPSNGGSITLVDAQGTEITLYLPVHQWWALRGVFPKATGYTFADDLRQRIADPAEADIAAAAYWDKHKPAEVMP